VASSRAMSLIMYVRQNFQILTGYVEIIAGLSRFHLIKQKVGIGLNSNRCGRPGFDHCALHNATRHDF